MVRIWREYLAGEHPVLRGEVEDLAKHERHPFSGIQELGQLIGAIDVADGPGDKSKSGKALDDGKT